MLNRFRTTHRDHLPVPLDWAPPSPYRCRAMPWDPGEKPWQYELLDKLPSGIDVGQLEENLKLTPTERLEKLRLLVEFLEDVRRAGASRLSEAP